MYLEPDANTQGIYVAVPSCVMMGTTNGAKYRWIQSVVKHFESFGVNHCDKKEHETARVPHCWLVRWEEYGMLTTSQALHAKRLSELGEVFTNLRCALLPSKEELQIRKSDTYLLIC